MTDTPREVSLKASIEYDLADGSPVAIRRARAGCRLLLELTKAEADALTVAQMLAIVQPAPERSRFWPNHRIAKPQTKLIVS